MEHSPQITVLRESNIPKRLIEADNRAAIHFAVLPVAAMHLDDAGLVTIRLGIRVRPTQRLTPIRSESLGMLRMEAVAERMPDHLVGHYPAMPCARKTAQPVASADCLEDSLHLLRPAPLLRRTLRRNPHLVSHIRLLSLELAQGTIDLFNVRPSPLRIGVPGLQRLTLFRNFRIRFSQLLRNVFQQRLLPCRKHLQEFLIRILSLRQSVRQRIRVAR